MVLMINIPLSSKEKNKVLEKSPLTSLDLLHMWLLLTLDYHYDHVCHSFQSLELSLETHTPTIISIKTIDYYRDRCIENCLITKISISCLKYSIRLYWMLFLSYQMIYSMEIVRCKYSNEICIITLLISLLLYWVFISLDN